MLVSDDWEYSNIWITWPSNINGIGAISRVQIYLAICLINIWHHNIVRYSFGELCGIQIYTDICLALLLLYLLITATSNFVTLDTLWKGVQIHFKKLRNSWKLNGWSLITRTAGGNSKKHIVNQLEKEKSKKGFQIILWFSNIL